jgi:hypothetical protein
MTSLPSPVRHTARGLYLRPEIMTDTGYQEVRSLGMLPVYPEKKLPERTMRYGQAAVCRAASSEHGVSPPGARG